MDNNFKDSIDQIKQMLNILGLEETKQDLIANEMLSQVLEKVYENILSDEQLTNFKQLIKEDKIKQAVEISNQLDKNEFTEQFNLEFKKIIEQFFKNLVEQCPAELLDELEQKLVEIENQFFPKA